MPVCIFGKVFVRIQQRAFDIGKDKLRPSGRRRPVHESMRFIGGIVKEIHADFACQHTGNGRVFLFGDVSAQRHTEPQARELRRVFVGGVEAALEVVEGLYGFDRFGRSIVHIQCEHTPAEDVVLFASAVFQMTAHETADVLDDVLLGFGKAAEFGSGFGSVEGLADPFAEVFPCDFAVFPFGCGTGGAVCDFQIDSPL